jgi:hypothetical protein
MVEMAESIEEEEEKKEVVEVRLLLYSSSVV